MMTIGSGLLVSRPRLQGCLVDHANKDTWQTTSTRTVGKPCQQGYMEDHVRRPRQQRAYERPRQQGYKSSNLKDHFKSILDHRSTIVEG
jgi:hypothetical protein